jgi:hypothetical protein
LDERSNTTGKHGQKPRPPRVKDLPIEILRTLPAGARLTLGVLCEHANYKPECRPPYADRSIEGYAAWPSVESLAKAAVLSKRAIQYSLQSLRQVGIIRPIHKSNGGSKKSTVYLITTQNLHPSTVQELRDSEGSNGAISDTEGCNFERVTVQPAAPKRQKNGFNERESSSTTTALITSSLQNHPVDWPAIQDLLSQSRLMSAVAIDGAAREQILEDLERQDMDGRHLKALLERYPIGATARNPVGVLLSITPKLKARLKHFDPNEPDPVSGFERMLRRESYSCQNCQDTGRISGKPNPWRRSVDAHCPDCELGKQALADDYSEIVSQAHRLGPEKWREQRDWLAKRGADIDRIDSLMGCLR